jgi:hypothetical protein
LWKLIKEKRNRKADTLEARLYKIIMDLVNDPERKPKQKSLDEDEIIVKSNDIWTQVKAKITGVEVRQSWESDEYGSISRKKMPFK